MTPGARVAAAAEVLDRVLAGEAAEAALTRWARASRFAGSGDRAAVRTHVFDALRRMRSLAARAGVGSDTHRPVTGRALMIGLIAEAGEDPGALLTGAGHALSPLTGPERAALEAAGPVPDPVRLDVQDWQLPLFRDTLGDRTEGALNRMRGRAVAFGRVNLALCTREAAILRLAGEGIAAVPHPLAESAVALTDSASRLRQGGAYGEGWIELQDASGQAACAMLPVPGDGRMLDFCAGGGGKTLAFAALAAQNGRALDVSAHDAEPARMADLRLRADRARLADCSPPVNIGFLDLAAIRRAKPFGLVLVDAPCSGSGTWARTPDAKWRLTARGLNGHVARQGEILDTVQGFVRPEGGVLAYMTCSLFAAENGAQVRAFCARHPGWRIDRERQFDPTEGGDGFYVAILSRSFA